MVEKDILGDFQSRLLELKRSAPLEELRLTLKEMLNDIHNIKKELDETEFEIIRKKLQVK